MRNVFMTLAAAMFATTAVAQETTVTSPIGGSVAFEISENAAGDFIGTTTLGTTIQAGELAFGGFALESVDGGTLAIDSWKIGTNLGFGTISLGDQGDLFVGNDFEVVGGDTLADPTEFESVIVTAGDAAVMVAFTDLGTDVTEVESVQGSYTLNVSDVSLTAVGDYNIDSTDYVLGGKAAYSLTDSIALGGLVTYGSANEVFAYEASAGYGIATAFLNGDDTDALQNVGAGVSTTLGGLGVYAEGEYNIDAEDTKFGAGLAFNF